VRGAGVPARKDELANPEVEVKRGGINMNSSKWIAMVPKKCASWHSVSY